MTSTAVSPVPVGDGKIRTMHNALILIVEDEAGILEAVDAYLRNSGYRTVTARDGNEALELFRSASPDMLVLDRMLPLLSGEEVCRRIRQQSPIPILMLTARAGEEDIVAGLAMGADDYVTKPFSPRELVARVQTLFRRCGSGLAPCLQVQSWNGDDLEVDFSAHTVLKGGKAVSLTPTEFQVLATLARHPDKVFTRAELVDRVLGTDFDGYDRTIDSHVKNLRAKIETDTADPVYILTIRGLGYRFGLRRGE